jgi:hypothetical protein
MTRKRRWAGLVLSIVMLSGCFLLPKPGEEVIYHWEPEYVDLYVNGELLTGEQPRINHGREAEVTIEAVPKPEEGWGFIEWDVAAFYFIDSSGEYFTTSENPFTFVVDKQHHNIYLWALRFSVTNSTISPDGTKVFMVIIDANAIDALLYDLKSDSFTSFILSETTEISIDRYGRVFLIPTDESIQETKLLNWNSGTFEPLDIIGSGNKPQIFLHEMTGHPVWSPDLSKCGFINNNRSGAYLTLLDLASGELLHTGFTQDSTSFKTILWSQDSQFLFSVLVSYHLGVTDRMIELLKFSIQDLSISDRMKLQAYPHEIAGPCADGLFYFGEWSWSTEGGMGVYMADLDNQQTVQLYNRPINEYYVPRITQYGSDILVSVEESIYRPEGSGFETLPAYVLDNYQPGDGCMQIPGTDLYLLETSRNGAYDIYLHSSETQPRRITRVEMFKD